MVSTMTAPVSASYVSASSDGASALVTGTGPWKWSAWVVPKQGIARPAWAHAEAHDEWVWTTPPTSP